MIDFVPSVAVLWFECRHEFDGEAIGVRFSGALELPFSLVAEITLRSAQVRRISWVRGVRPAGPRLSGLLVSAAFRPATYS